MNGAIWKQWREEKYEKETGVGNRVKAGSLEVMFKIVINFHVTLLQWEVPGGEKECSQLYSSYCEYKVKKTLWKSSTPPLLPIV